MEINIRLETEDDYFKVEELTREAILNLTMVNILQEVKKLQNFPEKNLNGQ